MTLSPEKMKVYQKEWVRKRRQDWLKLNGPCRHCGSWDKLEIDHVDPKNKLCNPTFLWSRKQSVRDEELAKCQVLCSKCHAKKTYPPRKCGTSTQYGAGCRCADCRKWRSDRHYRYKAKYAGVVELADTRVLEARA